MQSHVSYLKCLMFPVSYLICPVSCGPGLGDDCSYILLRNNMAVCEKKAGDLIDKDLEDLAD